MSTGSQNVDKARNGMTGFDYVSEVVGFLQIMASPLLVGLIVAAVVYFSNTTTSGLVIAIAIAASGLIIGIIFASRAWRKNGTMHFMSRVNVSPELDDAEEEKK